MPRLSKSEMDRLSEIVRKVSRKHRVAEPVGPKFVGKLACIWCDCWWAVRTIVFTGTEAQNHDMLVRDSAERVAQFCTQELEKGNTLVSPPTLMENTPEEGKINLRVMAQVMKRLPVSMQMQQPSLVK